MSRTLPWLGTVSFALLVAMQGGQDGPRLTAAIQALGADVPADLVPQSPAWQRLVQRYRALHADLLASAPGMPGSDLASAFVSLHHRAGQLRLPDGEPLRVLDELERLLGQRSGPPHGRRQLLRMRSNLEHDKRLESTQVTAWEQLVASFRGPKRIWVGCEAARAFITLCDRPLRAEALLTELLAEVEAMPDWDESVRRELARDLDLEVLGRDRPMAASRQDAVGQVLLLRGYAREQTGHLLPAMADLLAAQRHFAVTGNVQRSINCDHNLASIWLQLGRHDQAIKVAQQAEDFYRREADGNGRIAMQKVRAQALAQSGKWDAAEGLLQQLVVGDNVVGETNVDSLSSYMEVLLHLDSTPERVAAFDRQYERIRSYCGTAPSHLVMWRAELLVAQRHLDNGRIDAARRILHDAELPLEQHKHLPLQARLQGLRGDCDRLAGKPVEALASYSKGVAVIERAMVREQMWRLEGASVRFAQQFDSLLAGAHAAAQSLVQQQGDAPAALQALYDLVQRFHGFEALCRILTDSSAVASRASVPVGDLERLRHAAHVAERRYQDLLAPGQNPIAEVRLQPLREAARQSWEQKESELRLSLQPPDPDVVAGVTPSSLAQVQKALEVGDLLIECVETSEGAFAFALTREECRLESLPGGAAWRQIVTDLRGWNPRDAQREANRIPELLGCSKRLLTEDGWLARRLATGDIRRLLWSPEGSFGLVPLAALPFRDKPLVATLPIVHAISGSWLVQHAGREPSRRDAMRLLALGNPRYPKTAVDAIELRSLLGGALVSLPATAAEVLGVARWFATAAETEWIDALVGGSPSDFDGEMSGVRFKAWLGSKANESDLTLADLREYQVLHFACHGEGRLDMPSMSCLALTLEGDADHAEANGLLRLAELARLKGDFELVTLSACQTSVGTDRGHDGVAGLAWAAQLAGARRVLATLWSVPDAQTSKLIVEFYRHWLQDGMSCSDALAATQRAAIGKFPVRVWAPFVLWGEPR